MTTLCTLNSDITCAEDNYSGFPIMDMASIIMGGSLGCWSCAQDDGGCPTECPSPSSVTGPTCGTIVEVACPVVATAI